MVGLTDPWNRHLYCASPVNNENHHTMKPHQERIVAEKNELDNKRGRLTAFIGGAARTLDSAEQSRLSRQLEAMTLYSKYPR